MRRAAIPEPRGGLAAPAESALGGVLSLLEGRTMGTTWSVRLAAAVAPPGLKAALEAALDEVIGQMSHWEAASQISRFNAAPAGSWTPVGEGFAQVVRCALEIAQRTDGAFDPAMAGAAAASGFGPPGAETGFAPGGWRLLRLEDGRLFQPGGVRLDLSGIAKGFSVDRLAAVLAAHGVEAFLAEVGGELYGAGLKPDGSPWWVSLEAPREGAQGDEIMVALPGWAVATSGDYRRFNEADGRRAAHTLDPATGAPLTGAPASVTVLAEDCMRADAWATALTVMGAEAGLAFADRLGLKALFQLDAGERIEVRESAAWSALWA